MTKHGEVGETRATRRDLLIGVERYLAALRQGDPVGVRTVVGCRSTSNGEDVPLGSSDVWQAGIRIPAKQTFVDESTQSAVFFGSLTNTTSHHASSRKRGWFYSVRLKFVASRVSEVEEVFFEGTWAHYNTDVESWLMDPRFESVVPQSQVTSCEEIIDGITKYCAAVERTGAAEDVPLHPDARRIELGEQTTDAWNFPLSPRSDFANEGWSWQISNLRVPVVDTSRGVGVAIFALSLHGDSNPEFSPCVVVEAFKFEDGLIKQMSAVYHAGSSRDGWN